MAKHLVDIDEAALAAAQAELGTATMKETVNEALRGAKLLKVNEDAVLKEDVLEGMTAVVTVRLAEPQFEGQTKEVLGTSAASRIVRTPR